LFGTLKDSEVWTYKRGYQIFRKVYSTTIPDWILDFKENAAKLECIERKNEL